MIKNVIVALLVLLIHNSTLHAQNSYPWPSNGEVGIGTANPQYGLFELSTPTLGTNSLLAFSVRDGNYKPRILFKYVTSADRQYVELTSSYTTHIGYSDWVFPQGNIGIGTTTPDSKLSVAGKIHSREVKVEVDAGADFVFEQSYKLRSLAETEDFIKTNKRLPEISSANDMKKNGIELGEMNIRLLQKIEELTLYLIEQNKEIKKQGTKIKDLEEILKK